MLTRPSLIYALVFVASCAAARPAPEPALGIPGQGGLLHFLDALNNPYESHWEGWSPLLVAEITEARLRSKLSDTHRDFGACGIKEVLEADGSVGGRAELRCARGVLTVRWLADAEPPYALQQVSLSNGVFLQR